MREIITEFVAVETRILAGTLRSFGIIVLVVLSVLLASFESTGALVAVADFTIDGSFLIKVFPVPVQDNVTSTRAIK